ncbi:MAG TPA: hypothetical protein DCG75_08810 [Bacteroidales bacterium]|nr:hypothetical protein [Bacteroidales bacterium]
MNIKNFKYYFLIILITIPVLLLGQIKKSINNPTDTIDWNPSYTSRNDSLYVNNQLKSDRFYDSLKTKASKNKITKTALNFLLVSEPASGKFIGVEDLRNEEYYNLYAGKIIRNIEIVKLDVFGPTFKDTVAVSKRWTDKVGNKTHIKTREFIIRNNLFFSTGDSIDPVLLVDNERLLRELNYLKDASIQIAEVPGNPDLVDILVVTKDVYSAGFYVDLYNLESGVIELYENNLAGLGHKLNGSLYLNTAESPPTGFEINYNIDNIGGSFLKSRIQYLKAFETEKYGITLNRDFFTYNTKWAGSLTLYQTSTLDDIKKTDTTLLDVRLKYTTQDIGIARSFLLKTNSWQYQNRTRLIVGFRYINNIFYKGPEVSERYNFQYHDNQVLLTGIAFSRQRYYKSNLIYGFGKTEDMPIGCLIQLNGGIEIDEFYKRPYLGLRLSKGIYYPKIGYLNIHSEFGGLYYENQLEQGVVSVTGQTISNLHYINRFKLREFLSLNYTRGINRFSDEKVYLTSNDIWGFSSEDLFGIQKISFHSELVVFSNLYIYNFRFLFFGFGDLGLIGPENRSVFSNKLYSGIGLGIRIRNENLVFKTFQIRFAYYPTIPNNAEQFYYIISGENYQKPVNFDPKIPYIIEYR